MSLLEDSEQGSSAQEKEGPTLFSSGTGYRVQATATPSVKKNVQCGKDRPSCTVLLYTYIRTYMYIAHPVASLASKLVLF